MTQSLSNARYAAHMRSRRGETPRAQGHRVPSLRLWCVDVNGVTYWIAASKLASKHGLARLIELEECLESNDLEKKKITSRIVPRNEALLTEFHCEEKGVMSIWEAFLATGSQRVLAWQ